MDAPHLLERRLILADCCFSIDMDITSTLARRRLRAGSGSMAFVPTLERRRTRAGREEPLPTLSRRPGRPIEPRRGMEDPVVDTRRGSRFPIPVDPRREVPMELLRRIRSFRDW